MIVTEGCVVQLVVSSHGGTHLHELCDIDGYAVPARKMLPDVFFRYRRQGRATKLHRSRALPWGVPVCVTFVVDAGVLKQCCLFRHRLDTCHGEPMAVQEVLPHAPLLYGAYLQNYDLS